ncbi:MAG: hypothetical protein KDC83_02290 [Flavobacteriales bacterium]|nr:hypothetical protein [Flavobacteriales bacterium]
MKEFNRLKFVPRYFQSDPDEDSEELVTDILIDGRNLSAIYEAYWLENASPKEIEENRIFVEDYVAEFGHHPGNTFEGNHPNGLYLSLTNQRYWWLEINWNYKNQTLLLVCASCFIPGCDDIMVEVQERDEIVNWSIFWHHCSPKQTELKGFKTFSFTKQDYQNAIDELKKWIDENQPFNHGDIVKME